MDRETQSLWAFAIAGFAGTINYLQKFTGEPRPQWSWLAFVIKLGTSGFVGLLTHWLLTRYAFDENLTNFLIAIAGWGGAETVVLFQEVLKGVIRKAADTPDDRTKG